MLKIDLLLQALSLECDEEEKCLLRYVWAPKLLLYEAFSY
jgi:hypothetical protein